MIKTCDNCTKNCDAFDKVCCIFNSYCNFDPNNNAIKKEIEYNCKKCKNKKCDKCILKLTVNLIDEGKFDKLKIFSDKYNKQIKEETSSEITAEKMFKELGYEIDTTGYDYERHIEYHNSTAIIDFDLERNNVYKYNQSGCRSPIDVKTLKAINKQFLELGWLDEE